ncbi:MAG: hypothetical protein JEZ04_14690 [Spirochaetales bacterium]|nr:hypothetical protein [Spirochaetales bacterium]
MNNGINELKACLPRIKRARDFHLYDFGGKRYLDLWLDGGRAALGHKAGKIVREMKNSLEKGLSAGYPSVYAHRLLKQVQRVYPDVAGLSVVFSGADAVLPVLRPFTGRRLPGGLCELVLPMAGSTCLRLVCADAASIDLLPAPDAVPVFLLSGMCRAASELAVFDETEGEKAWQAFDSPLWRRDGPWLYPEVAEDTYPALFKALLGRGVVLSPDFKTPSCAPYIFTEGEIAPIKEIEREFLIG